jgi:hypothetical protein
VTGQCDIAGCAGRMGAHGWCNTHYRRWQRHGDPRADIPIRGAATPDGVNRVDAQRVISLYQRGASARTIARQFGIGRTAIYELLRNYQIPIRRPGPNTSQHKPDHTDHPSTNPNDTSNSASDTSTARTHKRTTTPRHPDPQGAAAAADGRSEPC